MKSNRNGMKNNERMERSEKSREARTSIEKHKKWEEMKGNARKCTGIYTNITNMGYEHGRLLQIDVFAM